jgi:hypothetical protein
MGTGAAPSSVCEVMDFGSVISRVSCESEANTEEATSRANARRLSFIDNPTPKIMTAGNECLDSGEPAKKTLQAPNNLRIL